MPLTHLSFAALGGLVGEFVYSRFRLCFLVARRTTLPHSHTSFLWLTPCRQVRLYPVLSSRPRTSGGEVPSSMGYAFHSSPHAAILPSFTLCPYRSQVLSGARCSSSCVASSLDGPKPKGRPRRQCQSRVRQVKFHPNRGPIPNPLSSPDL